MLFDGRDAFYSIKGKQTKKIHLIGHQTSGILRIPNVNSRTVIVVSDQLFRQLAFDALDHRMRSLTEGVLSDDQHSGALVTSFNHKLDAYGALHTSFYETYHSSIVAYGLIMFLGLFLGSVFLLATSSILYFKQMNEAEQEKSNMPF